MVPPSPRLTAALGVFAGYMMLDAWVANQDRHHQNWGATWKAPDLRLAPTFDHGASLARNLSDEERKDRLTTRDGNRSVERFAERAVRILCEGVGFVERKDDHVVVNVRGQTFFNVPTSGRHSVVVVDLGGFSSVLLRAGDYDDAKELLTAALSAEEGHF